MRKFTTVILTLAVMLSVFCITASAEHWYTMHDLNYMMEGGDYNAIVMEQVLNTEDKAGFADIQNSNEKIYISYHKDFFGDDADATINMVDSSMLTDFADSVCTEPNLVKLDSSYEGNKDDIFSFHQRYSYTDEQGYNGYKEVMMLKNAADLYLVEYYNDIDKYESDTTKGTLHYYYYFGDRKETDVSAPVVEETLPAIKIFIDGAEVISDVEPLIINDRTLVPVRTVAGGLQYAVGWDGDTRTVTLEREQTSLKIGIDHDIIRKQYVEYDTETGMDVVKSEEVKADVPAQIINDRTYLPVRAVSEALDCKVDWDGATRTIYITTVKTEEPKIETVYIGETGNEFHKKKNCVQLANNSGVGMPYDFALGQGRTPCNLCWD